MSNANADLVCRIFPLSLGAFSCVAPRRFPIWEKFSLRKICGSPRRACKNFRLSDEVCAWPRPAQFDGRKLGDVTPEELKKFKLNIQETTIQRFETPFDAPSN